MTEDQIIQLIQSELKKSQYKVGGVPLHTHNGIDSPKLVFTSGSGGSSINGLSNNPTITYVAGSGNQPLDMQTNVLASGITWDSGTNSFVVVTAGYYLVNCTVAFGAFPASGGGCAWASVAQNGTAVCYAYTATLQVSNTTYTASASIVIYANVGDSISFYAGAPTGSSTHVPINVTPTYTYGFITAL